MKQSQKRSAAMHPQKTICNRNTHQILRVDQVADEDFESSVLFTRHIQSGHGKLYIESLGLLSSTPLESLCDLMLSSCRLKLFHLESNECRGGTLQKHFIKKKILGNLF